MTRLLVATFVYVLAAAVAVAPAGSQRKPSGSERSAIARVVRVVLERDAPTVPITVLGIVVSTQQAGAASVYSKTALARFTGQDEAGNPLDELYAILGYSRRFKVWSLIDYGSADAGCERSDASLFGGRRAAIFRDLHITCRR